jgi:hypothetical protein
MKKSRSGCVFRAKSHVDCSIEEGAVYDSGVFDAIKTPTFSVREELEITYVNKLL